MKAANRYEVRVPGHADTRGGVGRRCPAILLQEPTAESPTIPNMPDPSLFEGAQLLGAHAILCIALYSL